VFRDYLTGAAIDLKVGDCFDTPTSEGVVEEVPHHPCTDAHDAEIFYVADYPASDVFPGDAAFDAFTEANCLPAFTAYTGLEYPTSEYDIGVFYPTEEGWNADDHEISCYAARTDYAKMTTSVKKQ
jgi:hypothetical protein